MYAPSQRQMIFRQSVLRLLFLCLIVPPLRADVVISEFGASNDAVLFDGLGEAEDWIEIHNPTALAVNLAGWKLRDSTTTWTLPTTTLPAGGFMIVIASGRLQQPYTDPAGYLHTTFKLDGASEVLSLVRPDNSVAHEFAAPVPPQKNDIGYGVSQALTTLTTFDTAAKLLVPNAAVDPLWKSLVSFSTAGWIDGKAAAGFGTTTFPGVAGTVAYRVLAGTVGNQDYGGTLGMDFVVNEAIQITELGCFDSGGNGIGSNIDVKLYARNDNGTPTNFADDTAGAVLATNVFATTSPGTLLEGNRFKPLASPLTLAPGAYTIVASGYSATELNGNSGAGWETNSGGGKVSFVGTARYGYVNTFPALIDGGPSNRYAAGTFKFTAPNDPVVRTNLQTTMQNVNASALMRVTFSVPTPTAYDTLLLDLPYNDGCSVWLNGTLIAARNAPSTLLHNSAATGSANVRETVPLSASLLLSGTNLLAIHGLNVAANSPNFFVGAQLRAVDTDVATVRYFSPPTPGAPNGTSTIQGYVADTAFSHDRGFYDAAFSLAITTPTVGATIRYTLDGSTPSETVGTIYSGPIFITTTSVVRAMAYLAGQQSTNVDTHTYVFANDVAVQSNTPPPGYPTGTWTDYSNGNGTAADYGMVSIASADYAAAAGNAAFTTAQARTAIANSIKALPVISIVTDQANFFDATTGIYLHPGARGEAWERACSVEMITSGGTEEFQVNAGIHIMGLTSRNLNVTPKLNMMLVFSSQYGANWLQHEFFGPDGPGRFKRIALRSNTRDGWLAPHYGEATYLVDGFAKEAQLDSGHPATRHRYAHVFINGMYWGLYNPTERPEDHWAETVLGGENEEYDIINLCCGNRLDAGDLTEWNDLMTQSSAGFATTAAYQQVQGNNPDGSRNMAYKRLLNVDNFIGYVLNGYHHANGDWPGNFFTAYDNVQTRTPGWRFITWDNDLGFQGFNVNANKVTPPEGNTHPFWLTSPGQVDTGLRQNAEYRMRLADTAYRYFFHEGPYSTPRNITRWNGLRAKIQPGLYAESARWGDYRGTLKTVQGVWTTRTATDAINFLSARNAVVISQLRAAGLYPALNPPELGIYGGVVPAGTVVSFSADPAATIYYTLGGIDPRVAGGGILPGASSGWTFTLTQTTTLRARAKNATEWSPLQEVTFIVGNAANAGELIISEFDYNPADPSFAESTAGHTTAGLFEFIELTNTVAQTLDLTGVKFTAGVKFTFPASRTLAPGASVLIVRNSAAFLFRYGTSLTPLVAGIFEDSSELSNNGETIAIADAQNVEIASVSYSATAPWPINADGSGHSLVFTSGLQTSVTSWRTSFSAPTPGEDPTLQTEWQRAHFTVAELANNAISGDLADPDLDGLSNLAEFATASDPRNFASGRDAVIAQKQPDSHIIVTIRRAAIPGITVTFQTSQNLTTWSDATASMTLQTSTNPQTGWRTETYRTAAPASSGAAFWRIRAVKP